MYVCLIFSVRPKAFYEQESSYVRTFVPLEHLASAGHVGNTYKYSLNLTFRTHLAMCAIKE